MGRRLTPAEAAAAIRRGSQVEQFVSLDNGQVTYLTAFLGGRACQVRRHVVLDEGTEDFHDLSAFSPVDTKRRPGRARS